MSYDLWYQEHKTWLNSFLTVALAGHAGLGMALAIFGPTQPYLAQQTGVEVDTINFIWTSRSLGVVVTSLATAFTFRKYCRSAAHKLTFLAMSEIVTGVFLIATPFATSFSLLLTLATLYGMGLGMFDTSDNSLMVYIFGAEKSRPFTQSLHCFVGVGFVIGSALASPFLPEKPDSNQDSVCAQEEALVAGVQQSELIEEEEVVMMAGISSIAWPYIIIALIHFIIASGFLKLAFSGQPMPQYEAQNEEEKQVFTDLKYWKSMLVMIFIYYALSCGLEGFFQSMTYTYGICGPLKMSVDKAAMLTVTYYACFMTGRVTGIFTSRIFSPNKLIFSSMVTCILSALVLCIFADSSVIGLFVGTGLLGFGIAVQFPSGISWTAKKLDVTGNAAFIFFTGGYTGFLSFPPLAGLVFTSSYVGPMGIFYLTLAFTCALLLHFCLMNILSRFKNDARKQNEAHVSWEDIAL